MSVKSVHKRSLLSGNEAVAQGAYEAGCRVACAYPGTPSTEILENLAKYPGIYAEWSTNEKVAMDIVSGACFAGVRAITAMKHVGLNVAADSFFSMSYSGVTGGLLIVSCDDPAMHSSQNEQDNRHYAKAAKVLMLEPSDSQETKDFVKLGFDLSEKFDTPVLLRITTRISHSKSIVEMGERKEHTPRGYKKDIKKRLLLPIHARGRHKIVEERLRKLEIYSNKFPYNRIEWGDESLGIITSGISYQYAKEAFPEASFLKLAMTYPIPKKLIKEFATNFDKIYVIEEGDPFLEDYIRALGINVIGKEKVPICGELDPSILCESIGLRTRIGKHRTPESIPLRPPVLCPGCPHRGVSYAINKLKLYAIGDIGCYTLGALPPLNAMDTCISMGASIGNAFGIEQALGDEISGKVVAILGDSTFFHAGIPSLIDIVYNKGVTTIIIPDNSITAMTGHQEHPGSGKTLMGKKAKRIKIEEVVRGCGVDHVYVVDPYDLKATKELIKREVKRKAPSVIIARKECALRVPSGAPFNVDSDKCTGCKLCIALGCPAITMENGKACIDLTLCNGCGMCEQVCVIGAVASS